MNSMAFTCQKVMEAADHIGYELDFMWHLSLRITEVIDSETENVDWTKVNALLLGSTF